MAVIHHHRAETVTQDVEQTPTGGAVAKGLAVLRIGFGITFLWAFFDKLLALGFHTGAVTNPETGARDSIDFLAKDAAWVNGGSPTEGFLTFGIPADNPFKETFNNLAGNTWVDWLFMAGLLGIGLALTFGVGMRVAAVAGAALYMLMYAASLPLENNPVFDDHLLGAITVVILALAYAGDTWGFGRIWAKTDVVKRYPVLR
jgi:thiosulfate dehydrogenase [quinone] large subunit